MPRRLAEERKRLFLRQRSSRKRSGLQAVSAMPRPECAPGTPAWSGTSTTVRRGLRLIAGGALDDGDVEDLSDRLGVTSRHLRRLFTKHLGASPLAVAHTQRLHFAKRLA